MMLIVSLLLFFVEGKIGYDLRIRYLVVVGGFSGLRCAIAVLPLGGGGGRGGVHPFGALADRRQCDARKTLVGDRILWARRAGRLAARVDHRRDRQRSLLLAHRADARRGSGIVALALPVVRDSRAAAQPPRRGRGCPRAASARHRTTDVSGKRGVVRVVIGGA